MDVTGNFFNKLRSIAVTLEKQTEQFKQVFHGDNSEFEDDSPMRYLHELYSEVRTLKGDADNTLCKSSSERDTTYDFIKASKVLMKRNTTDLKKISDLFQKYGYKPLVDKDEEIKGEAEINPESTMPDLEEPPNLDYPGKLSGSHSPLRIPQLSDFGLSKYALPNTLGTMHPQPQAHVPKEEPRADGSAYVSPKTEHFHIHGRDLCLNDETTGLVEDQTIFLLNNAKNVKHCIRGPAVASVPNKNLATPKQANKLCDFDYMASPDAPAFCTPGVKIPHRKNTVLQKSPEGNHPVASNHTTEKPLSNTQPLKIESKQMCVSQRPNKVLIKSADVSVLHSDNYPECAEVPSPPVISDYSNLFGTPPPPPAITVIPKQIFQILSKYNPTIEASTSVEREPTLGIGNKENREYSG
ncbi:spindle and kinetochore-associated protein 3 [Elgaria multicarinata webbii]|uniref:spindle and kinetochore-associated protein 3 n=1 Tax=Elgaria multicarinata webbii TaxID=159646 RepID=UPI002FCCFC26